jgi:uncharacterized protein YdeI (YjbR/CyaY-like superfamily)
MENRRIVGIGVLNRMSEELLATNRDEWRTWLKRNNGIAKQVWLIYYKKHTGKPSISYDDSVEQAICFGWIDGILKRLDNERCARKFMPRRSKSRWSELNKKRAEKMMEAGWMTEAGLARIKEAKESGEWFRAPLNRKELVVPAFMHEALARNKKALANFNKLANSYKRQYVGWVSSAKKDETRKRRLAEVIGVLEQNKKLGLK